MKKLERGMKVVLISDWDALVHRAEKAEHELAETRAKLLNISNVAFERAALCADEYGYKHKGKVAEAAYDVAWELRALKSPKRLP